MTTIEIIDLLKTKINNIKNAIINKGVDVPSNATLEDLPTLIENIESGGSGEEYTITDGDYLFYELSRLDLFPILKKHFALTSCYRMFGASSNKSDETITTEDINNLDLTNVTNCGEMFSRTHHEKVDGDVVLDMPKNGNLQTFAYAYGLQSASSISLLNSEKVTNWSQSFYTGFNKIDDSQNKKMTKLKIDMSGCTNCSNIFCSSSHTYSGCKFLTTIDFQGGSFGGNTTTSSLTLDLSKLEGMTKDGFVSMFNTMGNNTRGKTRIIKVSQTIYDSFSSDELAIATSKGYTVSY